MEIVVFSPADSYSSESLPLTDADEVTVICWRTRSDAAERRIAVPEGRTAARIVLAASHNVVARSIVRILPIDTGARFWRATRSDDRVQDAVRHADLLIAPERDGGFAVWSWRRRALRWGRDIPAVSGYPAARAVIEQRR